MPQSCPSCLWISSDEAEACERCGRSFSGRRESLLPAGAVGALAKSITALLAVGVAAAVAVRRLDARLPGLREAILNRAQAFYAWLLGPDEVFKPYLMIMLAITALTWFVLWLMARIRDT